jgi:hypothetical protein
MIVVLDTNIVAGATYAGSLVVILIVICIVATVIGFFRKH